MEYLERLPTAEYLKATTSEKLKHIDKAISMESDFNALIELKKLYERTAKTN